MSVIIGIDLGTSTTEAAIYRNGQPEMIPNYDGQIVTPSAVGIDREGNWVAGSRAMAQYLLEPQNTAIEIKRKTGTDEKTRIGRAEYSTVELQSRLLSHVRAYASEYLGENVDRAVISVPAYFDHIQRTETLIAGQRAGFDVERILNEPTAAAMSYGLDHMEEESHVLVYDLGGGTFDVTLLEMFDGVLEVKASSGDNQLGGKDFDERLMSLLLTRFQVKNGKNLRTDIQAMARLKEAAEACKKGLSEMDSWQVLLPALSTVGQEPVEMNETVTRAEFEEMTRDLLARTHGPIDTVLRDAKMTEDQIDRIILVGGSTRMPMVAEDVSRFLGKEPERAVHPDYAVAMGAAIQAGIITGEIEPEAGLIMTDVNPFSLGIATADDGIGDAMSVIIPRNTTIPVTRVEAYCTAYSRQQKAMISVYQGESMMASHNHYLGEFTIDGIPPAPAGKEKLDVEFAYDLNGLLKVRAVLKSTGREMAIQIDTKKKKQQEDLSAWKDTPGAKPYRSIVRTAERLLDREGLELQSGNRERLTELLNRLKRAVLEEKEEEAQETGRDLNLLIRTIREA